MSVLKIIKFINYLVFARVKTLTQPNPNYSRTIGPNDLCVMELNIRGLVNKQQELYLLLKSITQLERVDIVIFVQTWLTKENESRISLPSYLFYGLCRPNRKGRGVGFLIHDDINFAKRPDLSIESGIIENCFVELKCQQRNILLGLIYRPPNNCGNEFITDFDKLMVKLKKESNKEIVLGLDHNLDFLKHHVHNRTQQYLENLIDHGLLPAISCPTRITPSSAMLIDNILLSHNLSAKKSSGIIVSDLSDHLPCLSIIRQCKVSKDNKILMPKRKLTEKNVKKICDHLYNLDWFKDICMSSTNDMLEVFHGKLITALDHIAPEKLIPVSTNQVINIAWITPGIIKSSKKQLSLYKKSL